MRRPPFCVTVEVDNDPITCSDVIPSLMDMSLNPAPPERRRVFGVSLDALAPSDVPFIVTRLCHYIEVNGRATEGLFRTSCTQKAVAELKARFESHGNADLEAVGRVCGAACLLKAFLRELPESVIPQARTMDFMATLIGKNSVMIPRLSGLLASLPTSHHRLLVFLTGFLLRMSACEENTRMGARAIATVFGPCLFRVSAGKDAIKEQLAINEIVIAFITNHDALFGRRAKWASHHLSNRDAADVHTARGSPCPTVGADDKWVSEQQPGASISEIISENLIGSVVIESDSDRTDSRKRKEEADMTGSTSGRKIIRSYSAEGPLAEEMLGQRSHMRRFASHEDITPLVADKLHSNSFTKVLQECCEPQPAMRSYSTDSTSSSTSSDDSPVSSHGLVSPNDDDLHESRRVSERTDTHYFSQSRRRRRKQRLPGTDDDSTKENEKCVSSNHRKISKHKWTSRSGYFGDESDSDISEKLVTDDVRNSEAEKSLAHLYDIGVDTEPPLVSVAARTGWGVMPGQTSLDEEEVVLSPRNSLTLMDRPYLDIMTAPSPPDDQQEILPVSRPSSVTNEDSGQAKIHHLTKHINSLKRKVRQYEETYEGERGYRPSHADKMRCREVKRQLSEISKARKELKILKEDLRSSGAILSLSAAATQKPFCESRHLRRKAKIEVSSATIEDTIADITKRLVEKRDAVGRGENLEDMTREEVGEEKVALQKALLYLESLHGRPSNREDRDAVRPLYERYRLVKRILHKSGSPKMRDSVSELTTILEHEAMDFSSMPRSQSAEETTRRFSASSVDSSQQFEDVFNKREADLPSTPSGRVDDLGENLHSLPIEELMKQHAQVRERKKRLRRSLRDFEEEFTQRTGRRVQREDRVMIEPTYREYKQVKAMMRLLDALLTKHET